jgi:multidrug efflux pump subunit AcrA (membrane-fusion protein)
MEIQPKYLAAAVAVYILSVLVAYFFARFRANKQIGEFRTLSEALDIRRKEVTEAEAQLQAATNKHQQIDAETKDLQALRGREQELSDSVRSQMQKAASINKVIQQLETKRGNEESLLHELMTKLDLYTQIEGFVDHGHFEMPEYLYETSERFAEEIKLVRENQRRMISDKSAVHFPATTTVSDDPSTNKKILGGQSKLMLTAFNIECDKLIGRVKPSTFPATLERIEKLANSLEKSSGSFACGFDIDYVKLKFEECRLQFQFTLKKQEEAEEQRAIREQIREEQRAIKEYERAVADAEKEEKMYRDLLDKARQELQSITDEERAAAEARIAALEQQLAEAEAKEQRAKSMAEQTRKGHVYVISNLGSFGKDVYKIGLTRRLDPMDRVKELGDASVPFSFDVHAMIYVDDAPSLEAALHREFNDERVNLVNQRKEFFRVNLSQVKDAVAKIAGLEAEFKTTIAAEEYYESQRLRGVASNVA